MRSVLHPHNRTSVYTMLSALEALVYQRGRRTNAWTDALSTVLFELARLLPARFAARGGLTFDCVHALERLDRALADLYRQPTPSYDLEADASVNMVSEIRDLISHPKVLCN